MDVKSDVLNIAKLSDYFFVVPDYQREYVWKADDQVEQYLQDVDAEVDGQQSYFLGSIIVVKNKTGKFDVIDGQQRLTTIVITLCALRELLTKFDAGSAMAIQIRDTIKDLLYKSNIETLTYDVRLELQYEESKDFLTCLIKNEQFSDTITPSIKRMQDAYQTIYDFYNKMLENEGEKATIKSIHFLLTKVELVIIKTENISSALKIFETINQRGTGLNAMDLVKNLLFRNVGESDFNSIKDVWKDITQNLQACGEDNTPMRFLRYFLLARYYDGSEVLREDAIYKWLISEEGREATKYEDRPLAFAKELASFSKRYSDMVYSTEHYWENTMYPNVTNIGFVNKYKTRQHLILLMSLEKDCPKEVLEYLAAQIESYYFFCVTMRLQAKLHEGLFAKWAKQFRGKKQLQEVIDVVDNTLYPFLKDRIVAFKTAFMTVRHDHFNPLYRQRYVLGKLENTIASASNLPTKPVGMFDYQVEHILPQTPKDNNYVGYADDIEYFTNVYKLGNVTLLEGTMNQALNKCNDLSSDWFLSKQAEYCKSEITMTKLLDSNFQIGVNTALNRYKNDSGYSFTKWGTESIEKRQQILMETAFDAWRINGKRIDK